jgi:transcriptional regulator with XRE-family HTH domain
MGLYELRTKAGLSRYKLAALSGVHAAKIYQIEVGKIKPEHLSLRNAQKLADALDCSPKELLDQKGGDNTQ